MTLSDKLLDCFDWVYHKGLYSEIGQYLLLAYNTTFDDVLLVPRRALHSRHDADPSTILTNDIKLKIPIISSNMDTVTGVEMAVAMAELGGIGFLPRLTNTPQEEAAMVTEVKKRGKKLGKDYIVGISVGVAGDYLERAGECINAGADIIVFDIANGYIEDIEKAITRYKANFNGNRYRPIVAGNVATPGGVDFLAGLGVDCIKVGVGPGSVCTTRIVTGHGIPQLSAIYRCARKAREYNIPIIADGGIRQPADIVKALAVGAQSVMLGQLLASTYESPGDVYTLQDNKQVKVDLEILLELNELDEKYGIVVYEDGKYFKTYRGMSGKDVQEDAKSRGLIENNKLIVPEGVTKRIPYTGFVKMRIEQLIGGLRSGMSYSTAHTLKELQERALFEKVSTLGARENIAHAEEFHHYR